MSSSLVSLTATSIRKLIIASYQESLQMLDESAFLKRQRRSSPLSATHGLTFRRQTETETLEIGHAAEVFQSTVQVFKEKVKQRFKRDITEKGLLSWEHVELIAELSGCPPLTYPGLCQHSHISKYRSISGICNNRFNPLWGAANTALRRWLPAQYEDQVQQPKGWNRGYLYNEFQLPTAWEVSKTIMKSLFTSKDDAYSHMLVEWGQYIDHDMTFTPQSPGKLTFSPEADCVSTCKNVPPCFPIQTDGKVSGTNSCMPFNRSLPACFTSFGTDMCQALQQQQMNAITSFIDASSVYGSSPKVNNFLRDLSRREGKLKVNKYFRDIKGRPFLPFQESKSSDCLRVVGEQRVACFSAGDSRVNEGLPLTCLHTLWLRQHNQIAATLKRLNSHWNPEMIYQETRKIIGALHQIITMRDYLPKIIGAEFFQNHIGPYKGYDPSVDASASNVFATAAFRFGHGTISSVIRRLNERYQEHDHFPNLVLHSTFFSPWRILNEGGIEPILRGTLGTEAIANTANSLVQEELTERLVVLNIPQPMDLASLNLQRGRDHGLPGYNDWREFCGLKRIQTLEDLTHFVINGSVAEKILQIYNHPNNIDVWLGGLVEIFLPGARVGPVFACLIGKQMKALRDGDRFWWEAESMFNQQQRDELLKFSLSKIICDNSDIIEVPPDAFKFEKYPSGYVSCHDLPAINLEGWREENSQDFKSCGWPGQIKHGDYVLSSIPGKLLALYSCHHGFELTGAAVIFCEGHQWSNQPPQCDGSPQ
ncbi:thyroid peroxidase [Nerophis lumbriciformis]|uniref:thyroid peroxidase n=1 Tax=Nerophis lumbriciformis TaxID=546530 RepID=UPI002ADFCBC0|nr:thyroid peroxidase-like [Nerophis lumbriciformis]